MTGRPAESFAKAAGDGRTLGLPPYAKGGLEGFAFPGTYRFAASAAPAEILGEMVARVLHNRLARGMSLQVDSSVRYALGRRRGPVTVEDVRVRSPCDTYRHKGLPPGPVANPGAAALRAALHPAAGSWLYFVLTDPKHGTLTFATTEQEYTELAERTRISVSSRRQE